MFGSGEIEVVLEGYEAELEVENENVRKLQERVAKPLGDEDLRDSTLKLVEARARRDTWDSAIKLLRAAL